MPSTSPKLDVLAARAGELYSLPAVAVEVLELTASPAVDARQVKECIERDPALTIKILKVVNSSLFGLSKQVCDLNQALALLGMKPLKLLVLGFSLPDSLFARLAGDVLARYWERTLVKAIAARDICDKRGARNGDEAFIAGLLQDLGLLVLVQQLGRPYVRFLEAVHEQQGNLCQLERLSIGFDHVQLTARLLESWRLPRLIVDAVGSADEGQPSELAKTLQLAELVACLVCDRQMSALPAMLNQPAKRQSVEWINETLGGLQEKVEQLADVLSLELPQNLSYRTVLDEAHRAMVAVSSDLVGDLVRQKAAGDTDPEQAVRDELDKLSTSLDEVLKRPIEHSRIEEPVAPPVVKSDAGRVATKTPRALAATDPAALRGLVRAQLAACRQQRAPLSLLLLEIDRYEDVIFTEGQAGADDLFDRVRVLCETIDLERAQCQQLGDSRFAIALPDCDRAAAARLGNQLVRSVRGFKTAASKGAGPAITVSVGVATVSLPSKNFPPDDLLQSAERCLQGSLLSGGDVLKSIEIY